MVTQSLKLNSGAGSQMSAATDSCLSDFYQGSVAIALAFVQQCPLQGLTRHFSTGKISIVAACRYG